MSCVNTSHKEFKELAKELNINNSILELIIYEFQNADPKNENIFPSKEYIQEKLTGVNTATGKNQIKLWEQSYYKDLFFNSEQELNKAINKAKSFFPASAITSWKTQDGKFIMRVAKPTGIKTNNDSSESDNIMYQKNSKNSTRKKNLNTLRDYYKDTLNLREDQIEAINHSIEELKLKRKQVYYPKDSDDTGSELKEKLEDKIKSIRHNYGPLIKDIYIMNLPTGGKKININIKSISEIQKEYFEKRFSIIESWSDEILESEVLRLEQETSFDEEFYINPKKVPELKAQVTKKNVYIKQGELEQAFAFLESLENNRELNVYVDTCIRWLKNNSISLPRDNDKLKASFESARKLGWDLQQFKTPIDLEIALIKYSLDKNKVSKMTPIDPHKIPQFHFNRVEYVQEHTVEIYDVDDNLEGQTAVCQAIADMLPKDSTGKPIVGSRWCLSTFNYNTDTKKATPTDSAKRFWNSTYNKGRRQIAFINGIPVAFNSTSHINSDGSLKDGWWDYYDTTEYNKISDVNFNNSIQYLETLIKSNSGIKRAYDRINYGKWVYNLYDNKIYSRIYFYTTDIRHVIHEDLNPIDFISTNNFQIIEKGNINFRGSLLYLDDLLQGVSTEVRDILFISNKGIDRVPLQLSLHNNVLKVSDKFGHIEELEISEEFLQLYEDVKNITLQKKLLDPKDIKTLEEFDTQCRNLAKQYESTKNRLIDKIREEQEEKYKKQVEENNQDSVQYNYAPFNTEGINTNLTEEVQEIVRDNQNANNIREILNPTNYPIETLTENNEYAEIENVDEEQLTELTDRLINGGLEEVTVDDTATALTVLQERDLAHRYNEAIEKPFNKELAEKLHAILKKYHFEIIEGNIQEVFGDDVLGALDILQKIMYLAHEEDRNAITDAEEFAHAFIELMGSVYRTSENRDKHPETALYSELRDLIEDTEIYKATYEEYKTIYTYPNGRPDLPKIKKEALGKALAVVLTEKFEEHKDKTFLQKVKDWLQKALEFFKLSKKEYKDLDSKLGDIADSILDGSYAKKYLNKMDSKHTKLLTFENTLEEQCSKDNGKALSIMQRFSRLGYLITGSISYRAQGTVYRKKQDTLHDIDIVIPERKSSMYNDHPSLSNILRFPQERRWTNERLAQIVQEDEAFQEITGEFPNFSLIGAFPGNSGIVAYGIICDNEELKNKFINMEGKISDRLAKLTQSERDQIYTIDLFFNKNNNAEQDSYTHASSGIKMTHYKVSFEEKLRFGRAKDIFDYQMFNPHTRSYRITPNVLYQKKKDDNESQLSLFEDNSKEVISISYTPKGQEKQSFTVVDNKIYNKEGKEVYSGDNVHRNKILANVAVKQGNALVIPYGEDKYVVYKDGTIVSGITGKIMKWQENHGIRKYLTTEANKKFESKKEIPKNSKKITLSTTGYKKGDPQKNSDINYVFTENAEAYMVSKDTGTEETGSLLPSTWLEYLVEFPNKGKTKLNVSDVNGTNQAGIRTDSKGNISPNAYGIVVKKYQQDANGKFVAKEGQFQDTDEDFNLFTRLNNDMFKRLSESSNTKIIFPTQIALGKAALPKRFALWLQEQLKVRYGIISEIKENTRNDYEGYGLFLNTIENQEVSKTTTLTITSTNNTAKKAEEIGGIDTLRHPDKNGMHFGNPFSHTNYNGVQKVVSSVKEAAIAYEQWLKGEKYQDIEPERRQWILDQIASGTLKGKPLVYYTENIPDNSWGRATYDYYEAPNHAHILLKLINDEEFRHSLVKENRKELLDILGNDDNALNEVADVVKTVKEGITLEDALQGNEAIFTKEEIQQIKAGLGNNKLKVLSVSRQTDPAFYAKEIVAMLEENNKKSLDDPSRINVIELWSKHDGMPIQDILQACKKYKVAPMVSFSITGMGDTALEKGVLKYKDLLNLIGKLIASGDLNPATTTIRIDPILIGETKLEDIENIVKTAKSLGIKKFVTSLVQSYGYLDGTARDRKVTSGINEALQSEGRSYDWDKYYGIITEEDFRISSEFIKEYDRTHPGNNSWSTYVSEGAKQGIRIVTKNSIGKIHFLPKLEYINEVGNTLRELNKDKEIEIETCSFAIQGLKASACLDPLIIERITGISVTNPDGTYDRDTSRPDCMCYGVHSDIFRTNEKKCFSSCAYCYAGHSEDSNFKYYNEDGTLIDRPLTRIRETIAPIAKEKEITEIKEDTSTLEEPASELTPINIYAKTGENKNLSNFAPRPFDLNINSSNNIYLKELAGLIDDLGFNNVESAFHAAKILFTKEGIYWVEVSGKKVLTKKGEELLETLMISSGDDALTTGRNIKGLDRTTWDNNSFNIMKSLLRISFSENENSLQELLATGESPLTHTQAKGRWKEDFPKALMEVREEFKKYKEIKPELIPEKTETDKYIEKSLNLANQISTLLNNDNINATDVREFADQIVYWISDEVTEILNNPKQYIGKYPNITQDNIEDIKNKSRVELIQLIGIDNLLSKCKKQFEPKSLQIQKIKTITQAALIQKCWDGLLHIASSTFADMEKFSLITVNGKTEILDNIDSVLDEFSDIQDKDDLEEIGNKQEHWQVEFRTIDVLNSMSQQVRYALSQCYILDENGDRVKSDFNIAKRVSPRDATNAILKWTQGALNLSEMIAKLEQKEKDAPWLRQIITRLKDTSGKETDFQSQFFSVFYKHYQSYYTVVKEKTTSGKFVYKSIPVNTHPALKEAVDSITAMYTVGEHPLFLNANKLNPKTYKDFKDIYEEIVSYRNQEFTDEIKEQLVPRIKFIYNALGYYVTDDLVEKALNAETYKTIYSSLTFMIEKMESYKNKSSLAPFTYKSDTSIIGNIRQLLSPITNILEDTMMSSFHDNGKMYQSYVTPSYMTKLMSKFKSSQESFENFLKQEFGQYEWFNHGDCFVDIRKGWRNPWLHRMARDPKAREIFDHKVQLSFNKHNYMKNMNEVEYTLSILTEYWSESTDNTATAPAWFRVPMLSNKPSSEFIRFYSERGIGYKETLLKGFCKIAFQELSRIQTVLTRNYSETDPSFIKPFDSNGKKFMLLDFLNRFLDGPQRTSELGKLINKKVSGKKLSSEEENNLVVLLTKEIKNHMDNKAETIYNTWKNSGIVDGAKKIKGIGDTDEEVKENLINFIWNDTFASMNIMEITITDPAFYKDAEDLQKRFAQIHAPGIRGNSEATDYEGNPVTDGKHRTIYLKDFDEFKSNIIENLEIVFDRKIEAAPEHQKAALKAMKKSIIEDFHKINVTDAQAYSCPTSYRKKALEFGKWSTEAEEIYQKLKAGEYTYTDLQTAFQPLKPFVYSQIEKSSKVEGTINKLKVPIQHKNSEYLLILADAILQGEDTGRPNLLRAIFNVMEESAYDGKVVENGKVIKEGTYNCRGIDTIQFESAVKSGLHGAIDIKQFQYTPGGELAAKELLESLMYNEDGSYNETFVHEVPCEDYCLQQEVPSHFKDHDQAHGSQIRYIIPSDLDVKDAEGNEVLYEVEKGKPKVNASEFKKEYERTIAENIKQSIEDLSKELNITGSRKERNVALSKLLTREILNNPRYGTDLLWACSLDENGEFRIPLGDPVQSKRVEQLINSIIKNKVNKQTIAGGPIVQVSNFGTSKELNIRFKSKDGGLLMTQKEWEANKTSHSTFKEYISENQGGIAYFECFAPMYTNELFQKFADKDGNIDIQTIEDIDPDLLKLVGYRIPTEDKYSCVPLKIVGFLPREAGDGIMLPNDITLLSGSDFDVDKLYIMRKELMIASRNAGFYKLENEELEKSEEEYIAQNRQDLINHIVNDIKLTAKVTKQEVKAIEEKADDSYKLRIMAENRRHQQALEDIESRYAYLDEVNEEAIEKTSKESTEKFLSKKSDRIDKDYTRAVEKENNKHTIQLQKLEQSKLDYINKQVDLKRKSKVQNAVKEFLAHRKDNSIYDDPLMRDIRRSYNRYMYHTVSESSGRVYRNNKIVDMTYEILTHETTAHKLLNPGGFKHQKVVGYAVEAFRNPEVRAKYTFDDLLKMDPKELKKLCYISKNLTYIDTQVQFYKQNNAAGSLIGIFAVHKIAHAVLEGEGYALDISGILNPKTRFLISDHLFQGHNKIDNTFDTNGEYIGKVLGSLVAASADAVKDPVLNLMNINSITASVLNTLVRMGMPFEDAALFLSQKCITELLEEYNTRNIESPISIGQFIENKLDTIREENNITKQDEINNIEYNRLSREQLIKGIYSDSDTHTYKVLLAFNRIRKISSHVKSLTFVTRFNSISSAVGPQVIDNLILEYNIDNFSEFIYKDENNISAQDIFISHPILHQFSRTVGMAENVLQDIPINSIHFRNLLNQMPDNIKNTLMSNRKLLSQFADFYLSTLLVINNVIDSAELEKYIVEFPKELMGYTTETSDGLVKKGIKEKYPDNLLIQALQFTTDENTGRVILKVNTSGLGIKEKELLSSAWNELYKKDPELALKLFKYCFFKGGIGFNPKTFMSLLPIFMRDTIEGYKDTFRSPARVKVGALLDQFVGNNSRHPSLAPVKELNFKEFKAKYNPDKKSITISSKEDISNMINTAYFKEKTSGKLYKLITEIPHNKIPKYLVYIEIPILGNNGEYIEINKDYIKQAKDLPKENLNTQNLIEEEFEIVDYGGKSINNIEVDNTKESPTETQNKVNELIDVLLMSPSINTREDALAYIKARQEESEELKRAHEKGIKRFLRNKIKEKTGKEPNESEVNEFYSTLCN